MLSYLADHFENVFGPLRLLRFITFRTLMAAGTAMLIGFWLGPLLIAWLRKISFVQSLRDASEVGQLAAESVLDGAATSLDIGALSPERFAKGVERHEAVMF